MNVLTQIFALFNGTETCERENVSALSNIFFLFLRHSSIFDWLDAAAFCHTYHLDSYCVILFKSFILALMSIVLIANVTVVHFTFTNVAFL